MVFSWRSSLKHVPPVEQLLSHSWKALHRWRPWSKFGDCRRQGPSFQVWLHLLVPLIPIILLPLKFMVLGLCLNGCSMCSACADDNASCMCLHSLPDLMVSGWRGVAISACLLLFYFCVATLCLLELCWSGLYKYKFYVMWILCFCFMCMCNFSFVASFLPEKQYFRVCQSSSKPFCPYSSKKTLQCAKSLIKVGGFLLDCCFRVKFDLKRMNWLPCCSL